MATTFYCNNSHLSRSSLLLCFVKLLNFHICLNIFLHQELYFHFDCWPYFALWNIGSLYNFILELIQTWITKVWVLFSSTVRYQHNTAYPSIFKLRFCWARVVAPLSCRSCSTFSTSARTWRTWRGCTTSSRYSGISFFSTRSVQLFVEIFRNIFLLNKVSPTSLHDI